VSRIGPALNSPSPALTLRKSDRA